MQEPPVTHVLVHGVLIAAESAFPQKRFVKFCTSRFRGNVMNVATGGVTMVADTLSAADEDVGPMSPRRVKFNYLVAQ